jgi:hypothetical protein
MKKINDKCLYGSALTVKLCNEKIYKNKVCYRHYKQVIENRKVLGVFLVIGTILGIVALIALIRMNSGRLW